MKNKIDVSKWTKFSMEEIFGTPTRGTRLKQSDRIDGEIPLVTAGMERQGVAAYIANGGELFSGRNITIDMFGNVFYRNYSFYADDNVLVLNGQHRTELELIYIVGVLQYLSEMYSYKDQFRLNSYMRTLLPLPIDTQGQPDWAYMENYIKQVIAKQNKHLDLLLLSTPSPYCKKRLRTKQWSEFLFSDLFSIKKGKRLTKANMKDGDIRFIGASAINNGVTAHIANTTHLHPANTITVNYNGSVGEAFYQDKSFWASDDVNVLHLKTHHLSKEIALFLIPLIRNVGKRFKFDEKWTKDLMNRTKLKLPVDKSGAPDWSYMKDYISIALSTMENNQKLLHTV